MVGFFLGAWDLLFCVLAFFLVDALVVCFSVKFSDAFSKVVNGRTMICPLFSRINHDKQ